MRRWAAVAVLLIGSAAWALPPFPPTILEQVTLDPNNVSPHAMRRVKSSATSTDYLFLLTLDSPARLIRLNPFNLAATPAILVFNTPPDSHHNAGTQLRYRASDNRLYASFEDSAGITISRIDPDTMAYTDVIADTTVPSLNFGSFALTTTHLFAVTYTVPSTVVRYRLSDFAKVDSVLLKFLGTDYGNGHAIEADPNGIVFATGYNAPTSWVARLGLDPNSAIMISQIVLTDPDVHATDDLAADGTHVFIGFEGTSNIAIHDESDLTTVAHAAVGSIPNYGVFVSQGFLWTTVGTSPGIFGKMLTTSPYTLATFTLPTGVNTINEYADDPNDFQYLSTYQPPLIVLRLGAPATTTTTTTTTTSTTLSTTTTTTTTSSTSSTTATTSTTFTTTTRPTTSTTSSTTTSSTTTSSTLPPPPGPPTLITHGIVNCTRVAFTWMNDTDPFAAQVCIGPSGCANLGTAHCAPIPATSFSFNQAENTTVVYSGCTIDSFGQQSATVPFGTLTTPPCPASPCGDVNGDGVINIQDALVLGQYLAGQIPCGGPLFSRPDHCDVNNDGLCNMADQALIQACAGHFGTCTFTCGPFACPTTTTTSAPTTTVVTTTTLPDPPGGIAGIVLDCTTVALQWFQPIAPCATEVCFQRGLAQLLGCIPVTSMVTTFTVPQNTTMTYSAYASCPQSLKSILTNTISLTTPTCPCTP